MVHITERAPWRTKEHNMKINHKVKWLFLKRKITQILQQLTHNHYWKEILKRLISLQKNKKFLIRTLSRNFRDPQKLWKVMTLKICGQHHIDLALSHLLKKYILLVLKILIERWLSDQLLTNKINDYIYLLISRF